MESRFFDSYLKRPILWDCLFVAILWAVTLGVPTWLRKINISPIQIIDRQTALNYLSNLSSTTVTLAGFIIAALTILITVKSSLKARGFEDSENALEYLFSTKHYKNIVQVFINSIMELVLLFVALYSVWLLSNNVSVKTFNRILICSTFGVVTSTLRSIYILFKVLNLENLERK